MVDEGIESSLITNVEVYRRLSYEKLGLKFY
jgi:hypothetical protein